MNEPVCRVVRRAYFSSAVRCFVPSLSVEENQKIYGRLYTEHGMGHNYILDAYVEGPLELSSGMVIGLSELDALLKEITSSLDHKYLNLDVPYFSQVVPTAENIAAYCFERLDKALKTKRQYLKLYKIRLYETEDFWVDYGPQILSDI